jgi:alpha-beta hydrolase superfamily lysophospholipase
VDQVPRVFRDNSSDEGFLESVRRDPLQPRVTSLNWFNALVDWNERVDRLAADERPVLIIQGDADSVVDWDFNLAFLTRKFPNARVAMIEGGRHQLLNEAEPQKAQVLSLIDQALQD